MTGAFVALVVLASLPFLWIVARRPVLRRLAVRNAVRRPREAALVVVGSMLGAAIITGSFVVGDAMNASIRQQARAHLGPTDELVLARDLTTWEELSQRLQSISRREVDGVLPISTMQVGVTALHRGVVRSAPRSQVVGLDFAAARTFGADPKSTGISGPAPNEGHAAINADLADALGVRPGDFIDVNAYGTRTMLLVDRILPRRGLAGFWLGDDQASPNVIVPQSSFSMLQGSAAPIGAPPQYGVLISNRGGVESGVGRTDAARVAIAHAAAPLFPQVLNVKRSVLEQADAVGKSFTQLFTAMGSFGVIAGLLLLMNLFVMLAAERKPEMGMARAVGMRRGWVVGAFATEGWFYALVATALGTAAGVGLGRILVALSQRAFSSAHSKLDLLFVVRPASLAEAFAIGFIVALATILVTSLRVSRLNIIRAIRELPEPPPRRRRRAVVAGAAAAVLGGLWTVSAIAANEPFGLLLGPTLLLYGLVPPASRVWSTRAVVSLASAASIAWSATVLALFPAATESAPVTVYVVQGIVLTGSAVVFAALQQERIGAAISRFGGRALATRLGLAYPLARRSRTALTVAMYALVVFILTFITTLSHMIDAGAAQTTNRVRGGYDVVVSSSTTNPIDRADLAHMPGVRAVATLETTNVKFRVGGMTDSAVWNLTAFGRDFVANGPPRLEDRGSYPSDTAAWRAVLGNPNLIIVDPAFLQQGGGPPNFQAKVGTKIVVADPFDGNQRTVTVAALAPSDGFIRNGAFYGRPGAETMLGDQLVPSRFYVALKPGADPESFAASVQGLFLANGTEASSIRSLMDETFAQTHQIFQLFEGYLALGLLVGVAGIAVVMIRAVRERRRPIGALRAIGFPSRIVGRSFALETCFIAVEGTLIGASLALVTLYTLVTRSDAMGDSPFSVPWLTLAALLAGTIAASLLATVAPAVSAARIKPAVALRTTS
jgi:putative ABC transport system permease protein